MNRPGAPDRILTARQRNHISALPEDPSEEELARNWTLSETDRTQALRCRGDANRRRFAIQLCVVRLYGRFLDEYAAVPVRVLNHVSRQLQLPPVLSLDRPDRSATETGHEQRIREYLGYQTFDPKAREHLENHLRTQVTQGMLPADLFQHAEDLLRLWNTVLPQPATLERIVASIAATGRQQLLDEIAARLGTPLREAIDKLLQVGEGDRRSALFQFKPRRENLWVPPVFWK